MGSIGHIYFIASQKERRRIFPVATLSELVGTRRIAASPDLPFRTRNSVAKDPMGNSAHKKTIGRISVSSMAKLGNHAAKLETAAYDVKAHRGSILTWIPRHRLSPTTTDQQDPGPQSIPLSRIMG